MKNVLNRLGIFLFVAAVVLSCKKDDEDPVLGTFTVDGRSYNISHGAIFPSDAELNSAEETVYHIDVALSGPADHGFHFTVVSATETLESGTFTFANAEPWELKAGDMRYILVYEGETVTEGTTAGTIAVSKLASDQYTFAIQGTVNGVTVAAAFTGKVQLVEAN